MKSHCCNLEFPRMFISDDAKFPSRIFHIHLWFVFLQFKLPFVGREKICLNFYVCNVLISQQTALFSVSERTHAWLQKSSYAVCSAYGWVFVCLHETCWYRWCGWYMLCKTRLGIHYFNLLYTLDCLIAWVKSTWIILTDVIQGSLWTNKAFVCWHLQAK